MASSTPKANLTRAKELGKYSELTEFSTSNRRPQEKCRVLASEDVHIIRKCEGCGKNMSKVKDSLVCSCKKAIHCSKDCFKTSRHKCEEPDDIISPQDRIVMECDLRYLANSEAGPSSEKITSLLKRTKGSHSRILNYAERGIPMAAYVVGRAYLEREFDREALFPIPQKYTEQSVADTHEIAVKWLKVAAEGGVPEGMYGLFRVLVSGGGLRVDRRVAHFWLDKAYATGNMEYLVQMLQTPMDKNFPKQFEILFHNTTFNVTKGVLRVLLGPSFAHLLMATRFRELMAWNGKTGMGKRFYGFHIFKSVMEEIGELNNEESIPSLIDGKKRTMFVISARFGDSDFVDKLVSLEREENNLKFLQGLKEKTSPDYQLMCQNSNIEGRTSYLISCKHDKPNPEEDKYEEYSKIWGVLSRVENKSFADISKRYKCAGECEPCGQEAQQRLRAVSLGLFSISITPVFEDHFYAARYANETGVIVQDVFTGYSKPDMRQLLQCLMSNPADLHPLAIAEDGNLFWPIIWFWGSVYEAVQDTCDKTTLDSIYSSLGVKVACVKTKNASAGAAFPEAAAGQWRIACGNENCVKVDHEVKMSLCAGCKVRRYCNEACQKKDWEKHMHFCKFGKKQQK